MHFNLVGFANGKIRSLTALLCFLLAWPSEPRQVVAESKLGAIGWKIWSPGDRALRGGVRVLGPGERDIFVPEQDVISS